MRTKMGGGRARTRRPGGATAIARRRTWSTIGTALKPPASDAGPTLAAVPNYRISQRPRAFFHRGSNFGFQGRACSLLFGFDVLSC